MKLRSFSKSQLQEILSALEREGPLGTAEVAREAGLPVGKAEGLLRLLKSQGFVKEAGSPACRGCTLAGSYSGKRWELTEKRKEAVRREETLGARPR